MVRKCFVILFLSSLFPVSFAVNTPHTFTFSGGDGDVSQWTYIAPSNGDLTVSRVDGWWGYDWGWGTDDLRRNGSYMNGGALHVGMWSQTISCVQGQSFVFSLFGLGATAGTPVGSLTCNFDFVETSPPTYNVTCSSTPAGGGTCSGGGQYSVGDGVNISVVVNAGYKLDFVTVSYSGTSYNRTGGVFSFVMPAADVQVVANFSQNTKYTLTASASPAAGGSVSGSGQYYYGDSVPISVTTNPGYRFVSITLTHNGVSDTTTDTNFVYTMPMANVDAVANFEPVAVKFTVTVIAVPPEGGAGVGGGQYAQGAQCSVNGSPAVGWKVDYVDRDGMHMNLLPDVFAVTKDVTCYVHFVEDDGGGGGGGEDGDSDDDVPAINAMKDAIVAKLSDIQTGIDLSNTIANNQLTTMSDLLASVNEIKEKLKSANVDAGALNAPVLKAFELNKNLENSSVVDTSKSISIKQLDDSRNLMTSVRDSLGDSEANVPKIDIDITSLDKLGVMGDLAHIHYDFADPMLTVWRLRIRKIFEVISAVSVCVMLYMSIVWTIRTC